jgi:hypothetical protein
MEIILTGVMGLSSDVRVFSIAFTTAMPDTTFPKTGCWLSPRSFRHQSRNSCAKAEGTATVRQLKCTTSMTQRRIIITRDTHVVHGVDEEL